VDKHVEVNKTHCLRHKGYKKVYAPSNVHLVKHIVSLCCINWRLV